MPPAIPRTTMICGTPRPTMDMMVNKQEQSRESNPGIDKSLHTQVQRTAKES